jgi:hypothetical protein
MTSKIKNFFFLAGLALLVSAMMFSCAQVGSITGGEKDTTAPELKKSRPVIYSAGFDGKRAKIKFNEFYSLENIEQKFMMSPPHEKNKPKIKVKGKWLIVKFKEDLKPDTTYTLQFFDAVKDFNEGNKIDNFEFVFSTGNTTDSCAVSGQVFDAQTLEKQKDMLVCLYGQQTGFLDSVPMKRKPDYITRTDTAGRFKISNIRYGEYKIFALADINESQMFDLENEKIGFLKSTFTTNAERVLKIDSLSAGTILHSGEKGHRILDTLLNDTVIIQDLLYTTPNNIKLYTFEEEHLVQYISEKVRDLRCRIKLNFNKTVGEDSVLITYVDDTLKSPEMIYDYNRTRDSLIVWLKDTSDINNDTLELRVTFSTLDSLKRPITETDTISVKFKKKTAAKSSDKKAAKTEDTGIDSLNFRIKSNFSGDFDIKGSIKIQIPIVLDNIDSSHIKLYEVQDSTFAEDLNNKVIKTMRLDSANYRVIFKRPITGDIIFYPTDSVVRKDWYKASYTQNRDTVDIEVTDSAMIRRSKFPNILKYFNEYYLGQVQKIRDSVSTVIAPQKIVRYWRPTRDSIKIIFEKIPSQLPEAHPINIEKFPENGLEVSNAKESVTILLKDTSALQKDTLALKINCFDRQVFNKNKKLVNKFLKDTLFAIYKIPYQRIKSRYLAGEDTMMFVFEQKLDEMPNVTLPNFSEKENKWYNGFLSEKKDTFFAVVNDQEINKLDTINYCISYMSLTRRETDTLIYDTLKFVRPKKEVEDEGKGNRRRKSDAGRESRREEEENKRGMAKATLLFEKQYVMTRDTMNSKNLVLNYDFEPGKQYYLEIEDSTFNSVYSTPNLYLLNKAKIRELDYYGTMKINLRNTGNIERYPDIDEDLPPFEEIDTARVRRRKINPNDTLPASFTSLGKGQLIVCLCDDKGNIKYSKFAKSDGEILFDFILPADYKIKVIWDMNLNGKWDTGKYIDGLYPEKVLEFPKKQTVKSKWETQVDWKL